MADRRMFTKKVTDSDEFMKLSSPAQALYLHLSMSADDDGFCNQVSIAMFKAHASVSDLEALLSARYIFQFENGVIVIKHWRMANALRKDRYTPTAFQEELAHLGVKDNGAYTMLDDGCQMVANWLPDGCHSIGKVRLEEDRVGKVRLEEDSCTEPPAPPVLTMQLNTGEEYPFYSDFVDQMQELYPNVDVMQELRKMKAWLISNPEKRKTKKGIRRFVNSWLSKEQDKGGVSYANRGKRNTTFMDLYERRHPDGTG